MVQRTDLRPSPAELARRLVGDYRTTAYTPQTAPPGIKDLGEVGDVTWIDATDGTDRSVKSESERLTVVINKADQIASELAGLEPSIEEAQQKANDALAGIVKALYFSYDEWAISESSTEPPTSGWSTTTPAWHEGVYIWQRTTNEYGDGSVTVGEPVILAGAKGATGEDAVVLRIDSSRGTAFKNNAISTVLSVTVFKGSKQITDISALWEEFGPSAYLEWLWRRLDDSDFGLISAADDRLSNSGFSLTVSPADVDDQTVFQCVLHT